MITGAKMLMLLWLWVLIFGLIIIACCGCYISEFFAKVRNWFAEIFDVIKMWRDDNLDWGLGGDTMHGRGSYLAREREYNTRHRRVTRNTDIEDRIDSLIREIIKCRYCKEMLDNPPLTEYGYDQKMKALIKLEGMYPSYKKDYSPTQYQGFREDMAVKAYGKCWHDEWNTIKRTLLLTKKDNQLGDDRIAKLITIPSTEDFGY